MIMKVSHWNGRYMYIYNKPHKQKKNKHLFYFIYFFYTPYFFIYTRHYPIGLLYDMSGSKDRPWQITVHFRNFPNEKLLKSPSVEAVQDMFMSMMKQVKLLYQRHIYNLNIKLIIYICIGWLFTIWNDEACHEPI